MSTAHRKCTNKDEEICWREIPSKRNLKLVCIKSQDRYRRNEQFDRHFAWQGEQERFHEENVVPNNRLKRSTPVMLAMETPMTQRQLLVIMQVELAPQYLSKRT
jgi:hypothetical protein